MLQRTIEQRKRELQQIRQNNRLEEIVSEYDQENAFLNRQVRQLLEENIQLKEVCSGSSFSYESMRRNYSKEYCLEFEKRKIIDRGCDEILRRRRGRGGISDNSDDGGGKAKIHLKDNFMSKRKSRYQYIFHEGEQVVGSVSVGKYWKTDEKKRGDQSLMQQSSAGGFVSEFKVAVESQHKRNPQKQQQQTAHSRKPMVHRQSPTKSLKTESSPSKSRSKSKKKLHVTSNSRIYTIQESPQKNTQQKVHESASNLKHPVGSQSKLSLVQKGSDSQQAQPTQNKAPSTVNKMPYLQEEQKLALSNFQQRPSPTMESTLGKEQIVMQQSFGRISNPSHNQSCQSNIINSKISAVDNRNSDNGALQAVTTPGINLSKEPQLNRKVFSMAEEDKRQLSGVGNSILKDNDSGKLNSNSDHYLEGSHLKTLKEKLNSEVVLPLSLGGSGNKYGSGGKNKNLKKSNISRIRQQEAEIPSQQNSVERFSDEQPTMVKRNHSLNPSPIPKFEKNFSLTGIGLKRENNFTSQTEEGKRKRFIRVLSNSSHHESKK